MWSKFKAWLGKLWEGWKALSRRFYRAAIIVVALAIVFRSELISLMSIISSHPTGSVVIVVLLLLLFTGKGSVKEELEIVEDVAEAVGKKTPDVPTPEPTSAPVQQPRSGPSDTPTQGTNPPGEASNPEYWDEDIDQRPGNPEERRKRREQLLRDMGHSEPGPAAA